MKCPYCDLFLVEKYKLYCCQNNNHKFICGMARQLFIYGRNNQVMRLTEYPNGTYDSIIVENLDLFHKKSYQEALEIINKIKIFK